jgi:hypothetical protein
MLQFGTNLAKPLAKGWELGKDRRRQISLKEASMGKDERQVSFTQMLADTAQKVWGFLRGEVHVTVDKQPKAVILMRRTERGIVADVDEGRLPDYLQSVLVGTWTSPQALASAIMKRVATHYYVEPPVQGIDPSKLKRDAKTSISGQVRLKAAVDGTLEKLVYGIRNNESEEELERLFKLAIDLR